MVSIRYTLHPKYAVRRENEDVPEDPGRLSTVYGAQTPSVTKTKPKPKCGVCDERGRRNNNSFEY